MITMEQFCSSRGLTHELRQCSQGWIALVHCGGDIPVKIAGGYAAHPKDAVASLCERLEVSPPASLPPFKGTVLVSTIFPRRDLLTSASTSAINTI
jgi:hypothetical protein